MIFTDFLRNRRRSQLSADDLQALEDSVSDTRDIPARRTIARAGEPITFSTYLIEGILCRYMDDRDGERQLVAVHIAGDFVDLHGYPLGRLDHDVAALTRCKIALIPHQKLDMLVASRPALAKILWFSTLVDAAMHREWIFRLGRLEAVARVAHFLCETEARLNAVGRSDNGVFHLPMTQPDLGEACGMTSVHMNRMLRELRKRGLADVEKGVVKILDRQGLAEVAEFDRGYLFFDT
ncbi:MAG TPA: Crp/Fnr family transcriptional regulator [Sphingobium sp.]